MDGSDDYMSVNSITNILIGKILKIKSYMCSTLRYSKGKEVDLIKCKVKYTFYITKAGQVLTIYLRISKFGYRVVIKLLSLKDIKFKSYYNDITCIITNSYNRKYMFNILVALPVVIHGNMSPTTYLLKLSNLHKK